MSRICRAPTTAMPISMPKYTTNPKITQPVPVVPTVPTVPPRLHQVSPRVYPINRTGYET